MILEGEAQFTKLPDAIPNPARPDNFKKFLLSFFNTHRPYFLMFHIILGKLRDIKKRLIKKCQHSISKWYKETISLSILIKIFESAIAL